MSMYCPECRETCGFHERTDPAGQPVLDERGDPVLYRPHVEEARAVKAMQRQHEQALKLTADAHATAFAEAKRIIRAFAETRTEFSGNDTRQAFDDACIPSEVRGAAFAAVAREGRWIEHTGRRVPSTDPVTHGHVIGVYASLVLGARAS